MNFKTCLNVSPFLDKFLIAVPAGVTNFIKSVNRHAYKGVDSIHSLCCLVSISWMDFFNYSLNFTSHMVKNMLHDKLQLFPLKQMVNL